MVLEDLAHELARRHEQGDDRGVAALSYAAARETVDRIRKAETVEDGVRVLRDWARIGLQGCRRR